MVTDNIKQLNDAKCCPFCGGYNILLITKTFDDTRFTRFKCSIVCEECNASVSTENEAVFNKEDLAIEDVNNKWNSRINQLNDDIVLSNYNEVDNTIYVYKGDEQIDKISILDVDKRTFDIFQCGWVDGLKYNGIIK